MDTFNYWSFGNSNNIIGAPQNNAFLIKAMNNVFGAMSLNEMICSLSHIEGDFLSKYQAILTYNEETKELYINGHLFCKVRGDLEPTLEASLIGYAVKTEKNYAPLHAGSVVIDNKGILILGQKGSGKSTLSLQLADLGAIYLGDELSFINFDALSIKPFPKAGTLKLGSFKLFPETKNYIDYIRNDVRYYLPKKWSNDIRKLNLIIIPNYNRNSSKNNSIVPLNKGELAITLIQQCFGGLERDPRTINLIGKIANNIPAYVINYSSSEEASNLIKSVL